jgi:hypothetical protein
MNRKTETHVGSALDDFLAEQGVLEETTAIAIKRVIAWQLAETGVLRHSVHCRIKRFTADNSLS